MTSRECNKKSYQIIGTALVGQVGKETSYVNVFNDGISFQANVACVKEGLI